MQNNCPHCESEMTASSTGMLCIGCGRITRFYKTNRNKISSDLAPAYQPKKRPDGVLSYSNSKPTDQPKTTVSKKFKDRMRRMIVPELPDPQDADHLLESHLNNDKAISSPQTPDFLPDSPIKALVSSNTPPTQTLKQANNLNKRTPIIIFIIIALTVITICGIYFIVNPPRSQQSTDTSIDSIKSFESENVKVKRDKTRKNDIREIATALEVYKRDHQAYPVGQSIEATYVLSKSSPKYINYVNDDPLSSKEKPIHYTYRSDGISFILSAKLEISQDAEAIDGYYIIQSN